uniref:Uncharacterized protein n=1 Tax=Cucumis melo TaxID=3656 RepID=A0A9I9D909_CUCME
MRETELNKEHVRRRATNEGKLMQQTFTSGRHACKERSRFRDGLDENSMSDAGGGGQSKATARVRVCEEEEG